MIQPSSVEVPLELTSDQTKAINSFNSWLGKPYEGEPFVLSGSAGSGKTFLAMKFLQFVEAKRLCWTVAAPTHKAVGVLRKDLEQEGLQPTWYPSTIHRLLRLKLKRNGATEFCEETEQTGNSLEQLALVIVDESSMIDKELLKIILRCAYSFRTRLVFIGDPAQLPPIGESESSVFAMQRAVFAELQEVVRHQGSVLRLANRIRDGNFPCEYPPCIPFKQSSNGLVACVEKHDWLDEAKRSLKTASKNGNPDETRMLCYTNRVLESLIPHARRAIHGEIADDLFVLPGEVLITRKPVMAAASADGIDVGEEPDMLISSNREMVVIDTTPESCDLSQFDLDIQSNLNMPSIETFIAKVKCGEREFSIRLVPGLKTNARSRLDSYLKRLSDRAKGSSKKESGKLWRLFFLIRDSFASVGPASVLTVHRSQGSTFENVFVSSDVFWPKDLCLKKQLLYVAVSRASKQVWLVGDPQKELGDEF